MQHVSAGLEDSFTSDRKSVVAEVKLHEHAQFYLFFRDFLRQFRTVQETSGRKCS